MASSKPKETKLTLANKTVKVDLPLVDGLGLKALLVDAQGNMGLGRAGGAGGAFDGERPITRAIPGLQGTVAGGEDVVEFLNKVFFVDVAPAASLTASDPVREKGSPVATTLTWSVTEQSNPLTGITVNGVVKDPAVATSGTVVTATAPNTDTTFSMTATTAFESSTATASVAYRSYRYWFASAANLLTASDADLSAALRGQGAKEFATDRAQTRSFTLAGEYSYFAYPAAFGAATFVVGGLPNTAYQSRDFAYTNAQGFVETYRLYRSGGTGTGTIAVELH